MLYYPLYSRCITNNVFFIALSMRSVPKTIIEPLQAPTMMDAKPDVAELAMDMHTILEADT
jgi:hypothetical protein